MNFFDFPDSYFDKIESYYILVLILISYFFIFIIIYIFGRSYMSKNPGIDFVAVKPQILKKEKQISFNQIQNNDIVPPRKASCVKKIKIKSKSQGRESTTAYNSLCSFSFSIKLINLLRNPIIESHIFNVNYLQSIKQELLLSSEDEGFWQQKMYMHLMLAQTQNLEEMQNLSSFQVVEFNKQRWNQTNIMNFQCIVDNLKLLEKKQLNCKRQESKNPLQCHLVSNQGINQYDNDSLYISMAYLQLAMKSMGHFDIYFGPFVLHELDFQAYLWYHQFKDVQTALENYSKIFQQIYKESKEFNEINFQKWFNEQVAKILNDDFHIEELINFLNYNENNPYLQKLLIGLMGWSKLTEEAVKYLNVYYDNCDWQINSELSTVIKVHGQQFKIDYLVQNTQKNKQNLIICLKAPCFNLYSNAEIFSWHSPKLVQYISDDQSYLWLQKNFGVFKKSGFYDWTLFNITDQGKNATNKILDVGSKNKKLNSSSSSSNNLSKSAITVKSVKGRYIVQPQGTNDLSINQINIDSLNSDQGIYKASTFNDVAKQIALVKKNGINCVYLMGVFERDNQEMLQIYRKPNASPIALTNRTNPCKMLGKASQLKNLIQQAHKDGVKVIVDCTTRVSSSRMSKKYENLRLKNIDQHGKLIYHYGSNGRSLNYYDTTVLNYRKRDSWDLLISEIKEIIIRYGVDGIYLDNGFQWPQMFEINRQEMLRQEEIEGINLPVYSDQQIFQGEIVYHNKICGYWTSNISYKYPNPFLIKLCKQIWKEYPNCLIVAEGLQIQNQSARLASVIKSGPIPRIYKMPKALAQIAGFDFKDNGQISEISSKNINNLKAWYEEMAHQLPKNSILIHSTTSPVWPYLSSILKKAFWPVIDLYFFLPHLTITSGFQEFGRAYKAKSVNINYMIYDKDQKNAVEVQFQKEKKKFFKKNSSNFFSQEEFKKVKKGSIVNCENVGIKDPSQVKYLQQIFRKEVGPQFGFDLQQIHKHFLHRRELRKSYRVLRQGLTLSVTAEHLYGIHNNILSFVRYNDSQMLLISINFNNSTIDMHYNLTPLKKLFKKYDHSLLCVKIQDIFNQNKFIQEYYLVNQLINSKIQAKIQPYKTIVWRLTVLKEQDRFKEALQCSSNRMKQKLNRTPPGWIYSSVFFDQLDFLLKKVQSKYQIVDGLNKIYNKLIVPYDLNLSLVINKNYEFFTQKHKLEKLFGIFKLISDQPKLEPLLKEHIKNMLSKNTLGPITFVTPQIGSWSSVGGLGVMVDQLSKQLVKLGEEVYIITPYYEYNKKKETDYLIRDGFKYQRNIKVNAANFEAQFGIHRGKYNGVNYIWFHNRQLFTRPYDGQGAFYVTKQLVFFALITLQSFCQLKIFPSLIVTNDWMCGFVSAYVKCKKYKQVFDGTKFMHICHNLDPLYEGRLYPKIEEGNLNWLIQLPPQWYTQIRSNKLIINPSKCALETCDNWGTVSDSYKIDLLQESPLANILWKYPHPFSFPNGIRKDQRLSILQTKTPGTHDKSKKILQEKYFKCQQLKDNIPLFSFIGRITKQKGVHLILDAVEALLYEYNFNIQFLVGGMADSKEDYGKYCADKMRILTQKYPKCFWSSPDQFFNDGPLVNIGSDFSLMPSLFQPGGIVQHEFFCGGTPVIAFRTGGLKDTVFEFDPKTLKGNGFNFMSYDLQDFKKCMRRALECYKNRSAYQKLRENAFDSVVQQQDVARGWNNEFYRMQDKIYIDWIKVQEEVKKFDIIEDQVKQHQIQVFQYQKGEYWKQDWVQIEQFKEVLKNASRLKGKSHQFCFETKKIPRPKQVFICGNWDEWAKHSKLIFDKIKKNYKISLKLQPGTYIYKYIADGQWLLTQQQQKYTDQNELINHIIKIQ